MNTLSARTAHAATWMIAARFIARGVDFITLLVLARLLAPADFGLVAMAMSAILVAEAVLELPLAACLLQVREPTDRMYDTAFTLSILRGITLFALLAAVSWPLSSFYGEPRLPFLLCILSIAPVLRGCTSPRMVVFMKRMDFRREFALTIVGKVLALLIASATAAATGSYWAIVAATIANPLGMNILSYVLAPYRPRLTLAEWPRFAHLIGWNSVSQILSAIGWQLDRILLGRFVPHATLGRFSLAKDVSELPLQAIVVPLSGPLLAAFSSKSDGHAAVYCKASNAVLAVAGPVLVTGALLSKPLVWLVFGSDWSETAPILTALALIALFALPIAPMPSIALAQNRPGFAAFRAACDLAIRIPSTLFAVSYYGVAGVIAAHGATSALVMVITFGAVSRLTRATVRQQAAAIARTVMALACMAAVLVLTGPEGGSGTSPLSAIFMCAVAAALGSAAYLAALFGSWALAGRPDGIESVIVQTLSKRFRRM